MHPMSAGYILTAALLIWVQNTHSIADSSRRQELLKMKMKEEEQQQKSSNNNNLISQNQQLLHMQMSTGTDKGGCFERIAIGRRLADVTVSTPISELSDCEMKCFMSNDCKAFSFGMGRYGNGTCEMQHGTAADRKATEKGIKLRRLEPTQQPEDPDYDLFERKYGCYAPSTTELPPIQTTNEPALPPLLIDHMKGPEDMNINNNMRTCFRRLFTGRKLAQPHIRRSLPAPNIFECESACQREQQFYCEGFNFRGQFYREDRRQIGRGSCELTALPQGDPGANILRDFIEDREYDFYERRKGGPPECSGPPGGRFPPQGGPPGNWNSGPPRPNSGPYPQGPPFPPSGPYSGPPNRPPMFGGPSYNGRPNGPPPPSNFGPPNRPYPGPGPGANYGGAGPGRPPFPPALGPNYNEAPRPGGPPPYPQGPRPMAPPHEHWSPPGSVGFYGQAPASLNPNQNYPPNFDRPSYSGGGGGGHRDVNYNNNRPPGQSFPEDECFSRVWSGQRLNEAVIRTSVNVPSLGACQLECLHAREFACRAFSFRFGPSRSGPIDNCLLTDKPVSDLHPRQGLLDDPEYEFYERSSFTQGCEHLNQYPSSRPWNNGPSYNQDNNQLPPLLAKPIPPSDNHLEYDCYAEYWPSARLAATVVTVATQATTMHDCLAKCSNSERQWTTPCRSLSYRAGVNGHNCLLSELAQRDLKPHSDFVHEDDGNSQGWKLMAWDWADPRCREPPKQHQQGPLGLPGPYGPSGPPPISNNLPPWNPESDRPSSSGGYGSGSLGGSSGTYDKGSGYYNSGSPGGSSGTYEGGSGYNSGSPGGSSGTYGGGSGSTSPPNNVGYNGGGGNSGNLGNNAGPSYGGNPGESPSYQGGSGSGGFYGTGGSPSYQGGSGSGGFYGTGGSPSYQGGNGGSSSGGFYGSGGSPSYQGGSGGSSGGGFYGSGGSPSYQGGSGGSSGGGFYGGSSSSGSPYGGDGYNSGADKGAISGGGYGGSSGGSWNNGGSSNWGSSGNFANSWSGDAPAFTVNGKPCSRGHVCTINQQAGFWSCPIGDTAGSEWDYCCSPSHKCGYSEGMQMPWCYVGHNKDQWRPCSERYWPYSDSNKSYSREGRLLPVSFLHIHGPPGNDYRDRSDSNRLRSLRMLKSNDYDYNTTTTTTTTMKPIHDYRYNYNTNYNKTTATITTTMKPISLSVVHVKEP